MSCWPQPSSRTCGGPSGRSSPSRSGMKRRCGAAPTQTPPKPTSRPLTRFRWSANTLRRVEPAVAVGVLEDEDAVPGLVVGDATRVGVGLGDPEPAAVVDRHRDRLDDVGLAGEERDLEPRRDRHRPRGLLGAEAGVRVDVEGSRAAAVAGRPASRRAAGSRRS